MSDNARDEEPLAWCPGCGDRILTRVVRERGVCNECWGTRDDPWAAGRAETTTATTEDMFEQAWEVIARVRDAHPRTVDDAPTEDIVDALIDAGLLATARTRPTRDELAKVICESRCSPQRKSWLETADAVLALLRGGAR